jgi:ParB family chromosome partitioning protein
MACGFSHVTEVNVMPKKTEPKDTQSTQPEQVQQVRISDIHPFKNHPFKVVDDALMQETVDSIMQFGVLNPTIIRSDPGGGYEMVAGHRRLHASGLAGKDTIPAIVRNLTDDEAVILLVDTNLQRENISPMERAQAYKMKMEALKHQGQRTDLHKEPTSCQVGEKSAWAIAKVSEDAHQSERQVHRYLRLTELVPEIQKKVDAKEIAFNPAVELSYLKPEEQKGVLDAMEYSQNTPSLSQAQRLKKLSREGKCTQDAMYAVMSEEKKDELDRVTLKSDTLRKYFPKNYTPQQMEQVIIKLLEQWQKKRQRQNER